MHSGFIEEEREIMNYYHRQLREYGEKMQAGIPCDQNIAKKILDQQHPNRPVNIYISTHYDVIGVTMEQLCPSVKMKRLMANLRYHVKMLFRHFTAGYVEAEGEAYTRNFVEISEDTPTVDCVFISRAIGPFKIKARNWKGSDIYKEFEKVLNVYLSLLKPATIPRTLGGALHRMGTLPDTAGSPGAFSTTEENIM